MARDRRWYVTLDVFKNTMGETGTGNDAKFKRLIESASRMIEAETGRTFYPVTATKNFDVPDDGWRLYLQYEDLLSVTTLTDDTGTIGAANYWLYPLNDTPYHSIVLNTTDLGRHFEYDDDINKVIEVVGSWGFSNDTEDTGYTLDGELNASATTFTASATGMEVGWMLLIESEQLFISGVSSTTVTVQRAVNGTTSAIHADTTAISRYVAPVDIEAVATQLTAHMNNTQLAGGVSSERIEGYAVTYGSTGGNASGLPDSAARILQRYMRLAP